MNVLFEEFLVEVNALFEEFLVEKGTENGISWISWEAPLRVCRFVTLQDSTMPLQVCKSTGFNNATSREVPLRVCRFVTIQDSTMPYWLGEIVGFNNAIFTR